MMTFTRPITTLYFSGQHLINRKLRPVYTTSIIVSTACLILVARPLFIARHSTFTRGKNSKGTSIIGHGTWKNRAQVHFTTVNVYARKFKYSRIQPSAETQNTAISVPTLDKKGLIKFKKETSPAEIRCYSTKN